jgi:hypothetical protein
MMRPRSLVSLVAVACLALAVPAAADPGHGHGHGHGGGHVRVGVGVGWGWWGPGWYGSGWYGPGWWGPGWWGPGWGPGWYGASAVQPVAVDVGTVDTDISPEHARLFLDGTLIGTADDFDGYPSYLFLRPGHYTLEFRLQGYKTATYNLDVTAGSFYPLKTKLERIPGEKAAPWYDRPKGLPISRIFGPSGQPATAAPATAPSGPDVSLRPELQNQPGQPGQNAQPDQPAPPAPPVARLGAAIDLKVTPDNASVYLDGEFLGTAGELSHLERGVAVTPGQHQIEVMAPGHAPKTLVVQIPQGERRQVVVELDEQAGQPS